MEQNQKAPTLMTASRYAAHRAKEIGTHLTTFVTLPAVAFGLTAFLLGRCALPFSTYPLGLALLCASSEYTLFIAAGLIAAAFSLPLPTALTASVVVGTLLVRIAARVFVDLPTRIGGDGRKGELWEHLRDRLFCEGLYLRMASVCVSVFSLSLFSIIRGGFRYYDLFGALFSMAVAPIGVFLFCGLFQGEYNRIFTPRTEPILTALSEISLAVALCYALGDVTLYGISIPLAFGFVAVLITCRRRGLIAALLSGLFCGFLLGIPYIPVLLVSALAAFFIGDRSPALAASAAAVAGAVFGILSLGGSSVGTVFLPLFCGTAVYCTAHKLLKPKADAAAPPTEKEHPPSAERAAEAILALADVFATMSEQQKYPAPTAFCDHCLDCLVALCAHCESREICQLRHEDTLFEETGHTLARIGHAEEEDLPAALLTYCPQTAELLTSVNSGAADLAKTTLCSEKTALFADSYRMTATLLQELTAPCDDRTARIPTIRADYGSCLSAQEGVSGDVISIFLDDERHLLYAAINDGMGSGKEAALTAQLGSLFLRKLLVAGLSPETVLRMLNHFLRAGRNNGNTESCTTVDLLILDLSEGRACFLKSGAAPTYVKRGKSVFYLDSNTAPVGILREIDAKEIHFDVKAGDTIVMVSDGVTDGDSERTWLLDRIEEETCTDPAAFAQDLVARAADENRPDDVSVIVIRIDSNS